MANQPTPTSASWQMADRLYKGQLAERLTALRAEGRSWEEISRVMFVEAGVVTTTKTVSRWGRALGIADEARAS